MSSIENNKILAAVLCAGITAMLAGFVADKVISPEKLEKDAVEIEGSADAHGGGHEASKPQLPDPIMALLASASVEKGAKISKACAACHSFEKGGAVKQGPNLYGIVGAPVAAKADFAYSDALKEKGGNWDYDSLNNFFWKPKKYISGTKMNFAGLKKAEDRASLIAWLRAQSDAPAALPSEADIAAEAALHAPAEEEHAEEGVEGEAATEETPAEEPTEEEAHH